MSATVNGREHHPSLPNVISDGHIVSDIAGSIGEGKYNSVTMDSLLVELIQENTIESLPSASSHFIPSHSLSTMCSKQLIRSGTGVSHRAMGHNHSEYHGSSIGKHSVCERVFLLAKRRKRNREGSDENRHLTISGTTEGIARNGNPLGFVFGSSLRQAHEGHNNITMHQIAYIGMNDAQPLYSFPGLPVEDTSRYLTAFPLTFQLHEGIYGSNNIDNNNGSLPKVNEGAQHLHSPIEASSWKILFEHWVSDLNIVSTLLGDPFLVQSALTGLNTPPPMINTEPDQYSPSEAHLFLEKLAKDTDHFATELVKEMINVWCFRRDIPRLVAQGDEEEMATSTGNHDTNQPSVDISGSVVADPLMKDCSVNTRKVLCSQFLTHFNASFPPRRETPIRSLLPNTPMTSKGHLLQHRGPLVLTIEDLEEALEEILGRDHTGDDGHINSEDCDFGISL
eukprot:Tbor_TRINITY_DN5175_c1_g2::TRINITY_DN5175_c1_g2_i1::g.26314::m.26314